MITNASVLNTLTRIDFETVIAETGTVLWQPGTNSRFVVTDLIVTTHGTTNGTVSIYDGNDAMGSRLFKMALTPSTSGNQRFCERYEIPFVARAVNTALKLTTVGAIALEIQVRGYEISA